MGGLTVLKNAVQTGNQGSTVHKECRHCGTNVDHEMTTCPQCGNPEIATHMIE